MASMVARASGQLICGSASKTDWYAMMGSVSEKPKGDSSVAKVDM